MAGLCGLDKLLDWTTSLKPLDWPHVLDVAVGAREHKTCLKQPCCYKPRHDAKSLSAFPMLDCSFLRSANKAKGDSTGFRQERGGLLLESLLKSDATTSRAPSFALDAISIPALQETNKLPLLQRAIASRKKQLVSFSGAIMRKYLSEGKRIF